MQKLSQLESLCALAERNIDAEDGEEVTKLSCLGAKYSLRLRAIEQDFHDAYNDAAGGGGANNLECFEDARERIATLKAIIKKTTIGARKQSRVESRSNGQQKLRLVDPGLAL